MIFKNEQILNDLRDNIKSSNTLLTVAHDREKRENEGEKIVEETLAENFSNFVKNSNPQIDQRFVYDGSPTIYVLNTSTFLSI